MTLLGVFCVRVNCCGLPVDTTVTLCILSREWNLHTERVDLHEKKPFTITILRIYMFFAMNVI